MKICVAGQGAFGQKHLDALKRIQGVEVTSLVGGSAASTAEVAKKYGIPHHSQDLAEGIEMVMWLVMRGALDDNVEETYRFYTVPASNTAVGHIILENKRKASGKKRPAAKMKRAAMRAKIDRIRS